MSGLLTVVKSANFEPVNSISSRPLPSKEMILVLNIGIDWTLVPLTVKISRDSCRVGFNFNTLIASRDMKLRPDPVSR